MKRMREESGQAAIMAVLFLTFLLGFVGFAADVGAFLHAKRNLQIAADAAAIAGAKEIRVQVAGLPAGVADIQAAGKAASAQNGFTDGVNGTTVNVYPPPVDGPNKNKAGYVEAIVRQPQQTFFIMLLGFTSMPVAARAVAFNGAKQDVQCIRANNATGADTIHLQGSFTVDAPGCSVIDNSSDPAALQFTGQGGTLNAGFVGVVGGATGQTSDSSPAPTTGIPQTSDPLASQVTAPAPSTWGTCAAPVGTTWGPTAPSKIVCYSSDITVGNHVVVTMNPGTYVFTGNLDLGGGGTINGTGVTLYFPPKTTLPTTIPASNRSASGGSLGGGGNGNTTLNLSAALPTDTTSLYPGILIYEDAKNTNTVSLNGTPIANLSGIIYAPSAELDLSGNTNMTLAADLIVGSLYDKGNASITLTDPTKTLGGLLTTIALVE
jgi:hypothetical protein